MRFCNLPGSSLGGQLPDIAEPVLGGPHHLHRRGTRQIYFYQPSAHRLSPLGPLQSLAANAADPNTSEAERRILIDGIRIYLRDLRDVSAQEARAFQSELDKLAERVASAALGPEQASDHRRGWKVKP